jgi:SnoaL-like domain
MTEERPPTSSTTTAEATIAAWRDAAERGDANAAGHLLAAGIEVISPLTEQFRFRGPEQVAAMLAAAFETISDIRFHTQVGADETWALFYHARVGRQLVEEAQLLRLDTSGRIRELTLFGRPLPALTAVMSDIGPRLLRGQRRPALARLVGALTAPVAVLTRVGERRIVPLADPSRPRRG